MSPNFLKPHEKSLRKFDLENLQKNWTLEEGWNEVPSRKTITKIDLGKFNKETVL